MAEWMLLLSQKLLKVSNTFVCLLPAFAPTHAQRRYNATRQLHCQ